MKPISICIPTFNRAEKLAQCLDHLSTFIDKDFEIVIGNNCSTDNTDAVVREYSKKMNNIIYLKHSSNLGFARNMDAILRRATRDYLYILSDDDMVFESALDLAVNLMDSDPEIMGVVGSYYSLRQLNPELTVSYEDAIATTIGKNAYAALLENFNLCDGHPIMRRNIFQRNCAYLDRTGTLIPLFFKLISLGKVLAINKPFFQHQTCGESLSARMSDSWFIDMANADLELAVQQALEYLPDDALPKARQHLLHTIYFQASRMSIARGEPYLLWLFLKRLDGIRALSQDIALLCEKNFIHDILNERIQRQLQDSQQNHVIIVKNSLCSALAENWGVKISTCNDAAEAIAFRKNEDAVWLDDWPEGTLPFGVSTLVDVLSQVRLTKFSCNLTLIEDRLKLNFEQPEVQEILSSQNTGFQILCAPYSEV